jgi:hypothetical protein
MPATRLRVYEQWEEEMKKLLVFLVATIMSVFAFGQIPADVSRDLTLLASGKEIKCGGPLGHGTGTYSVGGKEIPFVWVSYTNNDFWIQVAISIPIYSFDLEPIRKFRDQIGRDGIWDARIVGNMTWVGMSNDIFCRRDLEKKYTHTGNWVTTKDGGKVGEIFFHYQLLKKDYLDRISVATLGGLKFRVIEIGT